MPFDRALVEYLLTQGAVLSARWSVLFKRTVSTDGLWGAL
jgi:hypothetical protein